MAYIWHHKNKKVVDKQETLAYNNVCVMKNAHYYMEKYSSG